MREGLHAARALDLTVGAGGDQSVESDAGFWRGFFDAVTDPQALQVVAVVVLVLVALLAFASLRRGLRRIDGRRRLVQYLDGVSLLAAGDPEVAVTLLREVVEADPQNVGARIAYGEALNQVGRHAEAHEQHLEAQESFGVEGPSIEAAIVRDLHAAGAEADALARVDAAVTRFPRDEALLRLAFELRSEAGLYTEALDAGRRLHSRRADPELARSLAMVAVRAGLHALGQRDQEAAKKQFREALRFDRDNRDAGRALAVLDGDVRKALLAPSVSPASRREKLLALEGKSTATTMATTTVTVLAPSSTQRENENAKKNTAEHKSEARDLATILSFFPEAVCATCGAAREGEPPSCPACGDASPPVFADAGLEDKIVDPKRVIDEIEQNELWFVQLCRRLVSGDTSAKAAIVAGGGRAIVPLLRLAQTSDDLGGPQSLLVEALVTIGQRDPEALLQARSLLVAEDKTQLESGNKLRALRPLGDVLAPVFRALGAPARASIAKLLALPSALADRDLRNLVIDYHVGLAELDAFEELGRRCAPVEIVRRLNQIPDEDLVPLFAQLPAGRSYLRDAILVDPSLDRPRALVQAALQSVVGDGRRLARFEDLFAVRGPGQRVLGLLVEALRRPATAKGAEALLENLRQEALEQLVAGFADPELATSTSPNSSTTEARSPTQLAAHARLILACGVEAADVLVRCFSSTPSEADDRVIALLAELGKAATAKLEASYKGKVGWLGAFASPGAKQSFSKHARACIARAIAATEGRAATKALQRLAHGETETELASLLHELLRQRDQGGRP